MAHHTLPIPSRVPRGVMAANTSNIQSLIFLNKFSNGANLQYNFPGRGIRSGQLKEPEIPEVAGIESFWSKFNDMPYLIVFLGGGLGSIVRLAMTRYLSPPEAGFPWATFGANIISSFILGWLVNHKIGGNISVSIQFFLMTGFCGGFSTFSTFSHEAFTLLQAGHIRLAFLYMGASMATGLFALFLGIRFSSLSTA